MILAQNHRLQLNGNKFLIILCCMITLGACSPKVVQKKEPVIVPVAKTEKTAGLNNFTQAEVSIFVPFKLNEFNPNTITKKQFEKFEMPLDFYQGLTYGFDSAATSSLNFKLNVFDTRDDNTRLGSLLQNNAVKQSNLIIGPVFPDGLKYITNFSIANDIPIVSPLAASKPSEFDNPNLISIVNDIDQHGIKIADYIAKHYNATNSIVVLINTQKTLDKQFADPIKETFKKHHPNFLIQEYTSVNIFETKMIRDKKYAVIICSEDVPFVTPSVAKLYKLKTLPNTGYQINLFGHPNWIKQNYSIEQLQNLNTIISSSYFVDYKSTEVINFVKRYRAKYQIEPSEYAFKGFGIGYYFGKLMVKYGRNYLDFIRKEKYRGLHNDFEFDFDPLYGYYNKSLMLLQYRNMMLNVID